MIPSAISDRGFKSRGRLIALLSQPLRHKRNPKLGLVPAAMLASPRAQNPADRNGRPTDQPKAAGDDRHEQMDPVMRFHPDEKLLMPAVGTIRTNTVPSHFRRP